MERCAECGYDYGAVARAGLPEVLRMSAAPYTVRLSSLDEGVLRAHPRPATWSPLEYACHVRDVFRVQRERVLLAQVEDQPTFASMRREERVTDDRYNEQPPTVVADEIAAAAVALADALAALDDRGWNRTGIYNWPVTQVRTVEWIARNTVHEAMHHLCDIDRLVQPDRG